MNRNRSRDHANGAALAGSVAEAYITGVTRSAADVYDGVNVGAACASDPSVESAAAMVVVLAGGKGKMPRPMKSFTSDNCRENLGIVRGAPLTKGEQAHHIVAQHAGEAANARKILEEFGIDVQDAAANGVVLSQEAHKLLHTDKSYYRHVEKPLTEAQTKEEAIGILDQIRKSLECGKPVTEAGS